MGMKDCRVLTIFALALATSVRAEAACPVADDAIATDRPSIANSSAVVPAGSAQFENGVSFSRRQGTSTYDQPETRVRLGLGACTEILLDLPDFTHADGKAAFSGVTNIVSAAVALPVMVTYSGCPRIRWGPLGR